MENILIQSSKWENKFYLQELIVLVGILLLEVVSEFDPFDMILFHAVILIILVSVLSMNSFIEGKEINNHGIEISEIKSNNDGLLNINEQFNLSSIASLKGSARTPRKQNLEAFMSTVEIIISRGYHAEIHHVTTDDDYILTLHRIPYAKGQTTGPITGRPIYIQHGIGESSADWVLLPTNESLAFTLADLGYDVWLGNFRGNTYSRGHVTLDSSHDDTYWKFSFDEMGRYDIPAVINHILTTTGRDKLIYAGMSMGTTAFFVCMNYNPELNDKIELMVAMAPITTLAHARGIVRYSSPLQLRLFQLTLWIMGYQTHFLSQDGLYARFVKRYCLKNARIAILCYNALFLVFGTNYGNMNPEMIRAINYHIPAGVSIRSFAHFGQNIVRDSNFRPKFDMYDYGWIGNLKLYGKLSPPSYDLSKVTVPVYIFHGANDYLATPKGIQWTASKLANVKNVFLVNDPTFNHLDMVFHRYAKQLVYNHIVEILPPP